MNIGMLKGIWLPFLLMALVTFCDDVSGPEDELNSGSLYNIRITLVNDTALGLNLVGPGEAFGNGNYVAGNGSRSFTGRGLTDRTGLVFKAGIFTENWVEVGHVTCVFDKDNYSASKDDYLVIYHGVGSMTCDNW